MIPRLRSLFRHGVMVSRTFSTEARYVGGGEVEILLSNGKTIRLTSNKLARLANGSCLAKSGNTSVMVTAVSKPEASSSASFMPLTVDYRQRSAAAGRIPTNFLRRELGSTEKEILTGRMIDRSLRPLFPKGFYADTQIVCNLLAVDGVNDPDILAINAASAALSTSDIPWNGPIGAIRVGLMGNNYDVVINPTRKELTESKLNMIVAGREDKNIFMIEASATEPILMNYITKALSAAQKDIKRVVKGIKLLAEHDGKVKMSFKAPPLPTDEQLETMRKEVTETLTNIFTDRTLDKLTRDDSIKQLTKETLEKLSQTFPESNVQLNQAFNSVFKEIYISIVREKGSRFDGRTPTELRPLHCEVGLFEPLHGSALFQRGQTQVLCSVALDSPNSVLKSDPVSIITGGLKEKNFMLHYEFPPFATKEISRIGGFNRRELGHGALAEKALRPLIPSDFPFTIRLTCDVLESNGSSSMASVCAGSMALMDAGVNIPENTAGVAMGLLKIDSDEETSDYILLTDIMGLEDYIGEMDFKVAGTKTAFTALQLDCKLSEGLPYSIVADALVKAHEAKGKIINVMNQCISSTKMSKETWPVSRKIRVPPHRRHRFLGFGGINVKRLTAETGVQVTEDIEDSQSFVLFAPNKEAMEEGEEFIQKLLVEPTSAPELEFGAIYEVEIIELRDTGVLASIHNDIAPVFVPNRELDMRKVGHPSALDLQVGQTISVKYFGRDPVSGHMRLSRRVLQMATPRAVKVPPVVDTSTP